MSHEEEEEPTTKTTPVKERPTSSRQKSSCGTRLKGEEKAFPKFVKEALTNERPLRANRRGIVPLNSESQKPTFTTSELLHNRRLGLSYKQIGKKLGIDPSKEEVLTVFNVIHKQSNDQFPNVEQIKAPSKISPPTPLWFAWSSELETISSSAFPSAADLLSRCPHQQVIDRLGLHAPYMLDIYLDVGQIVNEAILSTMEGAPPSSPLGQFQKWTNKFPVRLLQKAWHLNQAVANAAFEQADTLEATQGRCKCGSVKVLKFKWKPNPVPHPSFFWGCVSYSHRDPERHDTTAPHKQPVWDVIMSKRAKLPDKDVQILLDNLHDAKQFWATADAENDGFKDQLQSATNFYGGPKTVLPYTDLETLNEVLGDVCKLLERVLSEERGLGVQKQKK